jgi:hypothetical protein
MSGDVDGLGLAVQGESDGHEPPPADEYPTTIQGMDENLQKLVMFPANPAANR